jgi:tRNA threonylcarbamoyladenosine biosynthesis protein TsaE
VTEVTRCTHSADQTRRVAHAVATLCGPGDVVVLAGGLGSGKTTFVQGLAAGLDVADAVVSPTFTLARAYDGRLRLVHVDVYRLESAHELYDLGLDDLADGAVLVVEWGDVVRDYLGPDLLEVCLTAGAGSDDRHLVFTARGAWRGRQDALAALVEAA